MLADLRADTRDLHDQTEEAMQSARLQSEDFSKEEYAELLARLYYAHSRIDDSVYELLKEEELYLDLYYRLSRQKALERDLKALDKSVETSEELLVLDNRAEAWGALYVLEGSSLGGAMIYKSLRERDWPAKILNYYGYYGPDTGFLWKKFKQEFERALNMKQHYEAVKGGAEKAYGVFIESGEKRF